MVTKRFGTPTPSFSDRVLFLALRIPEGRVTTYGALARAAGGGPMASQSITAILGRAYDRGEKGILFHRIVYADGRIWVDEEHRPARMRRYKAEGIRVDAKDRILNFRDIVLGEEELRALVRDR